MVFTPRVGVYICHCGINIASTVDVAAVTQYASQLPGVVIARDYTYMCSDPGQTLIKNDIHQFDLNHVVVASCSPRMHEPTFRGAITDAGLNPYCLEMANIREQCSWVHAGGIQTTQKAMQLVSSAVAKAIYLQPLEIRQVQVTPAALIIGGGMAGMQAALDISDAGFQAILVERAAQLGGHVAQLYQTFPSLEPAGSLVQVLAERVSNHPLIQTMLQAEIGQVDGYVGNFHVIVKQGEGEAELNVGAIIIATGYEVFDARHKPELGYGVYPQVITTLDFERLAPGQIQVNGHAPRHVVFIQCVGSRDQAGTGKDHSDAHPYCSRVCCMVTAKQARLVRERLPEAQVTVFYMDVRAFGKGFEEFYDRVREEGVLYRRGNPSEIIRRGESVVVRAEDTLLGELVEVEADLVVLAVGMTPRVDAGALSGLLKLSRSADGFFLEAHPKLRPVETAIAGVYLAGCCQGPKDITDTINQARAAAASALIPLLRGKVQIEASTAYVDEELCSGCGQCAQVCNYAALALHKTRGVMVVNPVLCQGCGACAATCPSGAINVHQFSFDQVLAQVDALSIPI
jgi:heterodisulfide reductase subunit A2